MAKKRYGSKSDLSNIGPLEYPAGVPDDLDLGDSNLPDYAQALLNTISNTESAGVYNIVYRGDRINNYDAHPKVWVEIKSGPNKGKFSSAAGKYQFIEPTWRAAEEALGLTDFSPASQDKAAWWLAQRDYRDRTGRNLDSDLQAGGPSNMKRVGRILSSTWTSLPSGIEQGQGHGTFADAFEGYLGKLRDGPVPKVGIADDGKVRVAGKEFDALPAPAPLSFGKQTGSSQAAPAPLDLGISSAPARKPIGVTGTASSKAGVQQSGKVTLSGNKVAPAVTGLGLSVDQIGRQADNDRLRGMREIREMGPSSKGAPVKAAPAPVKTSGVVRTENQQAQLVPMPRDARPSSVPPAPAEPVIPKYIVTTTQVPIGKPTANLSREVQTTDRDMRNAITSTTGVKMPLKKPEPLEFKTIKKQELNPAWVEDQKRKPIQPVVIQPQVRRATGIGIGMMPGIGRAASMGIGLQSMSPAGRAAATPGISYNYSPVSHAGERTDVHGNDMAFQPRSVQTSDRHNTGY